ncbi:hypothetical protein E5D57_011321 [Metarhizium anisopliae]|nr:hypothetical protein E5D57_011321 [Metarhizium anisopliae]
MYKTADELWEAQRLHCEAATEYLMWTATHGEEVETQKCLQEVEDCSNTETFVALHDTSPIMRAISHGHVDIVLKIVVRTGWKITCDMITGARRVRRVDTAEELEELQEEQERRRKKGDPLGTWVR